MPCALGIDLGGTKILAGIVDTETGRILSAEIHRTRPEVEDEDTLARTIHTAEAAIAKAGVPRADVHAVGIGIAAQVDSDHGVVIRAPNLPDSFRGLPLADRVQEALRLPVTVVNDVVAAAAGEATFGAGRGCPNFVCIFVGTGIGGGIYQEGRLFPGATNTAGELGHMVIDYGGRICGCGGKGHLEAYASRSAIVRTILAALRQGRSSVLSNVEPHPDPDHVAGSAIHDVTVDAAVRAGDPLATEMVEDGARYMAAGLVSIINFYNPPRIILGGGMIEKVHVFFDMVRAHAEQEALLVPRGQVEIMKAALGDDSGVAGAAVLAMRETRGRG